MRAQPFVYTRRPMGKAKVFISHINEEAELAGILKKHLERDFEKLIEVFVFSVNISLGKRWLEEIHDELQTGQVEIILCSKESVQRPWINFECGAGWARNIPVVPVCHSGLEVDALPIPLKMLKGMQCNNPEGLDQLYALLAETLESVMPRPDFSVVVKEVMAFEEQYQTRMGIDSITQMNV